MGNQQVVKAKVLASGPEVEVIRFEGPASSKIIDPPNGLAKTGGNTANTWIVTGKGVGTLKGTAFTGIGTLVGGNLADTYQLQANSDLGSLRIDESAGGTDTLDFSKTTSGVTVDLSNNNVQPVNQKLDLTLTTGDKFENLIGGTGNDILIGSTSPSTLTGGKGDDTYVFKPGGGAVTIVEKANEGTDTLDYSKYDTPIVVDLSAKTATIATTSTTSFSNIENVKGGSGDDTLTGNDSANTLRGDAGDDTLTGGGGNDSLDGGAGSDIYKFSNGWGVDNVADTGSNDGESNTLDFSAVTNKLTFTIPSGPSANYTVSDTSAPPNTVSSTRNVQSLVGGKGENRFVFAQGANFAGTITGGTGPTNTLDYSAYTAANNVTVELPAGTATGTTGENGVSNIHAVIGGAGNDTYKFKDGWGQDTVSEAAVGGTADTLDFSGVTNALTVKVTGIDAVEVTDAATPTPNKVTASGNVEVVKMVRARRRPRSRIRWTCRH